MKLIACIESFRNEKYINDMNDLVGREDIEEVIFFNSTDREAKMLGVYDTYNTFKMFVQKNYAHKYVVSKSMDINEFFCECKDENEDFLLSTSEDEVRYKYIASAATGFKGHLSHRIPFGGDSHFENERIDPEISDCSMRKTFGKSKKTGKSICQVKYEMGTCTFDLDGETHTVRLPYVIPESKGSEGFTFEYEKDRNYRIKIWFTGNDSKDVKKNGLAVNVDKIDKVKSMIDKKLDHPQVAFPLALVTNKDDKVVGFVMRNFNDTQLLEKALSSESTEKIDKLEFIYEYAKLLFHLVAEGVVMVDLLHNSLKNLSNGKPCLIDVDSAQYGAYITMADETDKIVEPIPRAFRRTGFFYSTAAYPFIFIMLLVGVYTNPIDVFKKVDNRRKSYEEEESDPEVSVDSSPIPNKTLRDFVENVYTNTDENGKVKPVALERVMDLAEQLIREEKGESEATEEAASDEVKDTQADVNETSDTELTLEERLRRWREERNSSEDDADPLRGDALSIGRSEAPVPKPTPAPVASGCTDQGNNTTRRPEIKPGQNTVQGDEGNRPRPQPKPMQKTSQGNDSKGSSQKNTVKRPVQKTPQGNDSKGSSQKNTVKRPVQKTPQDNDSKGSSQNNTVKKPVQRTPQDTANSKRPEPGHRNDQRTLAARIGNFVNAFIEWLIDRSLSGTLPVGVNTRIQKINYIRTNKTQRNKVIFDGVKFAVTIALPIVLFLLILKFL